MKKLLWFLASAVLFLGTFVSPLQLNADGNPAPICPTGKGGCKTL